MPTPTPPNKQDMSPMLVMDEDWSPEEKRAATSRWLAQVAAYREKLSNEGKLKPSLDSAPPASTESIQAKRGTKENAMERCGSCGCELESVRNQYRCPVDGGVLCKTCFSRIATPFQSFRQKVQSFCRWRLRRNRVATTQPAPENPANPANSMVSPPAIPQTATHVAKDASGTPTHFWSPRHDPPPLAAAPVSPVTDVARIVKEPHMRWKWAFIISLVVNVGLAGMWGLTGRSSQTKPAPAEPYTYREIQSYSLHFTARTDRATGEEAMFDSREQKWVPIKH